MIWAVIAVVIVAWVIPLTAPPASAVTEYRYEVVLSPPTPLDYKGVAWAPDGSEATIVGGVQALLRYDPDTGRATAVGDGNWSTASQVLEDVAYTSDTKPYLSGGRLDGSTVTGDLWRMVDDNVQLIDSVEGDVLEAVSSSPDGRVIVVGTLGTVLEERNGTLVNVGSAGDVVQYDAAWAPDGSGALIVGAAGSITWFDAKDDELVPVSFTSTHPLYAVAWNPDSGYAWAVGEGGLVVEVNSTTLETSRVRPFQPRDEDLFGVSWHPDGEIALVVGEEGVTFLYRMGVFTRQIVDVNVHLLDVQWNPAGDEALVVGEGGTVLRYSPRISPQNRAPDAIITSPSDGSTVDEGISIVFDGSTSTDPEDDPLTFTWSNSTGIMGTGPVMTRADLAIGSHTVTLHVDDGQGHNSTDVVTVNIVKPTPPEDRLHIDVITPRSGTLLSGEILISGTASFELGEIVSVEINIDGGGWRPADGTSSWSMAFDTTLLEDGIHSIVVHVIASNGIEQTDKFESLVVEIRNAIIPEPPAVPNITLHMRDHGKVDELIQFSAEGEDLSSWLLVWSFGDGSNGQGTLVRHAYREEGTYQVVLELWLEGYDEPAAAFTATVLIESAVEEGMSLEMMILLSLVVAGAIYVMGYYGGKRAFRRD
jgi:hypothetical protein